MICASHKHICSTKIACTRIKLAALAVQLCTVTLKRLSSNSGAYDVQQATKLAGKPMTLKSDDGLGLITRDTLNKLHEQAAMPEATSALAYVADGVTKIVNVMFDHAANPIEATPFKGFNSPNLDDYFAVTLKFKTV